MPMLIFVMPADFSFCRVGQCFVVGVNFGEFYNFGAQGDTEAQAHSLFRILREADECDYDVIFAPLPRAEGIGLALYNRMIRAAAYKIIKL